MSVLKQWKSLLPKSFMWRLSLINIIVIGVSIAVSGWAVYHTACFLVEGMGNFNAQRQRQFNATLFQYLWMFSIIFITLGSTLHFYFVKTLIQPIRMVIESTKKMKQGDFPAPIERTSQDEIGQLVVHFNDLVKQLQQNEEQRRKLVADLSHELRTPLANLNGYLQALQSGMIEGDTTLYQSLYKESERLTSMVKQLEQLKEWDDISYRTYMKKEVVNIKKIIEQCVNMFEWSLKKTGIPVQIDVEKQDILVHKEGLQQVVSNLIDNAILYYQGEEPIEINGQKTTNGYYVSVTGPSQPIDATDKEKVFDRFYRIDPSRNRDTGGSGLGLAIAKEIVEQHNGKIGVTTEGELNRFWFEIPLQ